MHRVAPPRTVTTFQVRLSSLGVSGYPGVVASIILRRDRDGCEILVKAEDEQWEFVDVEDGLAAPVGGEPKWMDAVLDYVGVELAR